MIPKIIHTTWKDYDTLKDRYISLFDTGEKISLLDCLGSFTKKNPSWSVKFYDDNFINEFFYGRYNLFYPVFQTLKPIEKVDLFRYACLYEYGGLFLDPDCFCVRPLDEFLNLFPNAKIIAGLEFQHLSNWFFYPPHKQINLWAIFSTTNNHHMRNILGAGMGNCTMNPQMPVIEKTSMALFGDYLYKAREIDKSIEIVSDSYLSMDARYKYMHSNSYGTIDGLPAYITHGYHSSWVDDDFRKYAKQMEQRDNLIR